MTFHNVETHERRYLKGAERTMRIDCEMHAGAFRGDPYTWLDHPIGPADLEVVLDEYKIDMAVVMAPTAEHPDNESLAEAIQGSQRLIGFAVVNPYGPEGGVPELAHAVQRWRMKGLKLMPLRHGYEVDGDVPRRIMVRAAELGIPVVIHSGASQFCLPWQIGELARAFPSVPIVMDHMGFRYYVEAAIQVAQRADNVYLETALVSIPGYIRMAVEKLGAERVIYGSDFPTGHPGAMLATIKAARLATRDEVLLMGGNLARLLRL